MAKLYHISFITFSFLTVSSSLKVLGAKRKLTEDGISEAAAASTPQCIASGFEIVKQGHVQMLCTVCKKDFSSSLLYAFYTALHQPSSSTNKNDLIKCYL